MIALVHVASRGLFDIKRGSSTDVQDPCQLGSDVCFPSLLDSRLH